MTQANANETTENMFAGSANLHWTVMLLFAHVTDGTLLGQDVNWNTPNRRLASDLEITVNNPNGKKSLPMGGSNLEFAVSSKTRVQLARGRERDRSNTVSSYYVVCCSGRRRPGRWR